MSTKTLFAFGLNHKSAPVEVREKLYINEEEIPRLTETLRETLSECFILSTCNRTEIYGVSDSAEIEPDFYKDLLIDFKKARGLVQDEHFFTLISCPATQQLFSIATSIDSKVVGDTQILKQIREAYIKARENGSAGKVINQLLQRALKIGKKTYTETAIHAGAVSVSLAAVELAVETFGSLHGRSVMVLGAGEMARLTAEALVNKRVGKILISNRTRSHAEELLSVLEKDFDFESKIVDFPNFKQHLPEVDIVISATGSDDPILIKEDLANQVKKTLLIDIAVPRDIEMEVTENPNVILNNIDDLNSIIDGAYERRMKDLPKVKRLVKQELAEFLAWYYAEPLMPVFDGAERDESRTKEILQVKEFLSRNASEIHKVAMRSSGDFRKDLEIHASLIRKLQSKKAAAFEASSV